MGADLREKRQFVGEIFEEADQVLGFPISELMFKGPLPTLSLTVNAQPALLTVSVAALEIMRRENILPDIVAGHSLGEYSALVAAGVVSYHDALRIVRRRGELMAEACPEGQGGMAAVLGLDVEKVEEVCQAASDAGWVGIANFNCPGQLVISGENAGLEKASRLAKEEGAKRVVPLKVSGPFHSPLMKKAAEELAVELEKFEFKDPALRFFTNVRGRELKSGEEIKRSLVDQLTSCVVWDVQVRKIIEAGATQFFEVGPGKVLRGLMRRINSQMLIKSVEEAISGLQ